MSNKDSWFKWVVVVCLVVLAVGQVVKVYLDYRYYQDNNAYEEWKKWVTEENDATKDWVDLRLSANDQEFKTHLKQWEANFTKTLDEGWSVIKN